MRQDNGFNLKKTLAFWRDAARRLALTRINGEAQHLGSVTADDLDDHLDRLRRESEHLLGEGTPYVPALIRLFVEADADLAALLEAYGRDKLQPSEKDAVTSLMKQMPGLWAAATELTMINQRDRLLDLDDEPGAITPEALIEADKKKRADPRGPWTTSERPAGAWPDFHSLTIW